MPKACDPYQVVHGFHRLFHRWLNCPRLRYIILANWDWRPQGYVTVHVMAVMKLILFALASLAVFPRHRAPRYEAQ